MLCTIEMKQDFIICSLYDNELVKITLYVIVKLNNMAWSLALSVTEHH